MPQTKEQERESRIAEYREFRKKMEVELRDRCPEGWTKRMHEDYWLHIMNVKRVRLPKVEGSVAE